MKNALTSPRLLAIAAICILGVSSVGLPGCYRSTSENDQQLRQKSADATRDVKKGAKQLSADAKVAAANAVNGVNAVAQGVKDGIKSNKNGASGDTSGYQYRVHRDHRVAAWNQHQQGPRHRKGPSLPQSARIGAAWDSDPGTI
jgi:hypothetical protein